MKNFNPLVSIIIPVFNGENYIAEAIDSALAQTYKNIEVIVVNDGSKDKTDRICKSYNNKIKYIKKENGGVASALNLGIKEANGKYISWLSHDDLYDQNKILVEIDYISKSNNEKTIVACNYDYIDKNGKLLFKNETEEFLKEEKKGLIQIFNYNINGCALLINKCYFEKYGFFNEKLYTTQDFDMWFRIFRNTELTFINEYLVHSRVHENQGSKALIDVHIKECDDLWINFIKSLSKKEKENIYGDEYAFYKNLLITLKKHVIYPNVFEFLEVSMIECIKKDIDLINKYLLENYNYKNDIIANYLIKKEKKPTIFFGGFGPWQDRGGLNRVVANIANNLSRFYNVILLTHGDINAGYEIDKNVFVLNINFWRISGNFNQKFYYLLKLMNVDIFINPYNCVKPILELCKYVNDRGIKTIAWNHEYYFLPYFNQEFDCVVPIRNDIFKDLSMVIWLTSASKVIYDQFANNSVVLNNALTVNENLISSDFTDRSIVSIGRFEDKRKCAETLIILAKKLKDANIKIPIKCYGTYDLDIIGNITNKKLKNLITEYDLSDNNIEFMGFTNNIDNVLKHAFLNIVPSYHEGFGLTIIESATYGIPTIAFNDSGFEDMIINNYNGFLVKRNDFNELIEIIKKILDDNKLFGNLSNNAREYVKKFKMEEIIKRWVECIDFVLEDKLNENNNIFSLSENIDKNNILINGIKEYEAIIKQKINSTSVITTQSELIVENKVSIFRKIYRKLPLDFRKKIKNSIKNGNGKLSNFIKNRI